MSAADEAGIRYEDKVTIVTGGSRGIGRSCVETFGKDKPTKMSNTPFAGDVGN